MKHHAISNLYAQLYNKYTFVYTLKSYLKRNTYCTLVEYCLDVFCHKIDAKSKINSLIQLYPLYHGMFIENPSNLSPPFWPPAVVFRYVNGNGEFCFSLASFLFSKYTVPCFFISVKYITTRQNGTPLVVDEKETLFLLRFSFFFCCYSTWKLSINYGRCSWNE